MVAKAIAHQPTEKILGVAVREIAPVCIGDTVVIRTKDIWSMDAKKRAIEYVRGALRLPGSSNVLVLDGGAEMDVVRGMKPPMRGT